MRCKECSGDKDNVNVLGITKLVTLKKFVRPNIFYFETGRELVFIIY